MSVPLDLTGVRAKLERTEENIRNIAWEITVILNPHGNAVISHENEQVVDKFINPHLASSVPPRLSVLAGECVHNLRSSLDQFAWQLVLANGGTPGDKTSFPIYVFDPSIDKDSLKRYSRAIEGMSDAAKASIQALQPHQPYNGRGDNALALLHALSIADKHHALLAIRPTATHTDQVVGKSSTLRPIVPRVRLRKTTKDGTVIIRTKGGHAPVNVDSEVVLQISFVEFGSRPLESVVESLWFLLNAVKAVVDDLAAL